MRIEITNPFLMIDFDLYWLSNHSIYDRYFHPYFLPVFIICTSNLIYCWWHSLQNKNLNKQNRGKQNADNQLEQFIHITSVKWSLSFLFWSSQDFEIVD